jgi:hypothetical protein
MKITKRQLEIIVENTIDNNLEDRQGELYSEINKLIDMEYSDLQTEEVVEILENILQNMKAQSQRSKKGRGHITKVDVMKNFNYNE